nr:hypothetical protein [Tanacetum cinerariifolium]
MNVKGIDLMQLSLEVVKKLKKEIRIKENNSKRSKITRYPDNEDLEPLDGHKFLEICLEGTQGGSPLALTNLRWKKGFVKFEVFDNETYQMNYHALSTCSIHSRTVIDWSFFAEHVLGRGLFESINTDPFYRPQWVNLFRINKPVYRELVREFFAFIEFKAVASRVGLYYESQGGESRSRVSLQNVVTKSLIAMDIAMELEEGRYYWPEVHLEQLLRVEDKVEEAMQEEADGSSDVYRNISRGDWQIDPFLGRETDYPPIVYTRPMPLGNDYHYGTALDGSS